MNSTNFTSIIYEDSGIWEPLHMVPKKYEAQYYKAVYFFNNTELFKGYSRELFVKLRIQLERFEKLLILNAPEIALDREVTLMAKRMKAIKLVDEQ